jgi:hypothetical protein
MKHFVLLSAFIISFVYTPLLAQVEKEDSCLCGVKYLTGKPDNYYNPALVNSATFCDSLDKMVGHPIGVITSDTEDSGTIYPVDIHFQVNTKGGAEALKLSPCLGSLKLYIEERLPQITSLMNWQPAYYLHKQNKKGKKELATAKVVFNLRYNSEGIITAIFFNDLHEELFRCEAKDEESHL